MNEHLVIFKEQDKQLEELFKSVKRQKEIAQQLNEELDSQNQLLEDLREDVEITQQKVKLSNKRLDTMVGNQRTWFQWIKSWIN
jgi:septal ring factor EnvC (AmiA/AmiB activator)